MIKKAKIKRLKMQTGDVEKTHGNNKKISDLTNFRPRTSVKKGIKNFIDWYEDYYR